MYPLLLITVFLPQISAYVDCKVACYRCRENKEHPLVLEVHCAMCNECKQRRRDRMNGTPLNPDQEAPIMGREGALSKEHSKHPPIKNQIQHPKGHPDLRLKGNRPEKVEYHLSVEDSEECPTPPPCESEEREEAVTIPLKKKVTIATTTTTQATTTKKHCPPVVTCRKKIRKKCPTSPCILCVPMMGMAAPCPLQMTMLAITTPQTVKTTDSVYVYVGVPKNLINQA